MTREAAALRLTGLGAKVRIDLGGSRASELRHALEAAWSRCTGAPSPSAVDAGTLRVELREPGESAGGVDDAVGGHDLAQVLQRTTQTVTHALIRARAGSLLMLHAGACSDPRTGATVAFVAPGGTGKTTMTCRLGREFGYVTDETVGVQPDGVVVPYSKPLSIRATSGRGPKAETSPDELGLLPAPPDPRLGRVVLLRRDPGHVGPPRLTPLGLADAIVDLAPESSSLSSLPRPLHLLAGLIESTGAVLRCEYAEADEAVPLLREVIR